MVGMLIRYLGFMGTFLLLLCKLLSWMFEHDCLNTCCFGSIHVFCIFVFAPVQRN